MQCVIFDPTIIINHGLKILDPNSITVIVYLIYLHIMQRYIFTTYILIIIHLLVVLVVLGVLCLLLVLYLIVVLAELCVKFPSLILTLTIQSQCNKMFHQVKTLN